MKTLLSFAAAALAVLIGGAAAQAQHGHGHGGFGHGHGGFGHGYSHGHGLGHGHLFGHGHVHGHVHGLVSGNYYGSAWVGYPYSYGSSLSYPAYSYPSVVTTAVQPTTTIVPLAGVTTSTSLKPNALSAYTGPGVTLRLPAEFPGSVYVQIDKRDVELKPGTEVVLKDKASYLVEFDRGGDFGTSSGAISEGAYKFAVGEKGWYMVPDASATGGPRRNTLPGESKK